jgi:hypothetical protein
VTAAATACSGSHATGSSSPTAVAKAKAEAEWPEGNDVEPGILTARPAGTLTPARSGRSRRSNPLPTRLAVAEASPMLATPSRAARRGRPGVSARAAAMANHSLEWSAADDSRLRTRSRLGEGVAATAR